MPAEKPMTIRLKYYEAGSGLQPLVLLHAQGVDSLSLSKRFHVYAVDCYGHGGSLHDPSKYNVKDIGGAVARLIEDVERVARLIRDCSVARFDCGHGIHTDKPKEFLRCVMGQDT